MILLNLFPQQHTKPFIRAGFPNTRPNGGTSFVTTLPAPTMAYSPIVIPQIIVEFAPMLEPFLTTVGTTRSSPQMNALGYRSFVKTTEGPTKTSSSISTPLYIVEKFWIFTLFPI